MPTNFVDGQGVDEGDLDPMVANIVDLRDAVRVLQGKIVGPAGFFASGVAGTEINFPELVLQSQPVEINKVYYFCLTLNANFTAANTSFFLRVRQNTALTGSVIVSMPWVTVATGTADDMKTTRLPWVCPASGTFSFHVSAQRLAGTATGNFRGEKQTAHSLERAGDNAAGIWTVTV